MSAAPPAPDPHPATTWQEGRDHVYPQSLPKGRRPRQHRHPGPPLGTPFSWEPSVHHGRLGHQSAPPTGRPPKCSLAGRWGVRAQPPHWLIPAAAAGSILCLREGRPGAVWPGSGWKCWVRREAPSSTGHYVEMTRSRPRPSRSHLQPASYGPVLSPMNKAHGGVNKLPSVNQLVGQPPPHGSAAGPNLGPMGKWLRQGWHREGWGGTEGRSGSRHSLLPSSGLSTAASHRQLPSTGGRHSHGQCPQSVPHRGSARC